LMSVRHLGIFFGQARRSNKYDP